MPLTARLLSLGAPQSGKQVNFFIDQGSGSLSSTSAVTDSSGYASVNLTVTNFAVGMQLSACVAPSNNPCQNISANPVSAAMMNLQAVAGAGQVVTGAAFQPLTVRVTDSSTPPNPVLGASVLFQSTVLRPAGNDLFLTPGDPTVTPDRNACIPQRESEQRTERRQWPRQCHAVGRIVDRSAGD